ncbi:hypothetical protein [Tranquillimonas alkanivorans]|uniref:HTH crp-type domain-containing protein n=1 Tax=Tranquillimonas alkanivorans TaxID=441119 RepID=A0A1I5WQS8_9RHOB|nr:hypothetical protein [Tranquillimonas alkanivorans]SFQ21868.1 hypothetical protein SAMN04488047_1532 [Tranquillimonas alkanivorans]
MPSRRAPQDAFIKKNFRTVWPVHLAGFTRLLVQLRKRFDGDLDLPLVLAVIGSRTQPEHWAVELMDLGIMTSGSVPKSRQLPINIQSVAEYSGIPRETVRRKVAILQERGRVTRAADGRLAVAQSTAHDLEDATGETIDYLTSLLMAFQACPPLDEPIPPKS